MTYGNLTRKRAIGLVLAFLTMGIVLSSVGAQIAIQNDAMAVFNTEVLVLQVGSEANVQLAVDTFLERYPNPRGVKVVSIGTQEDLFNWILQYSNSEHVIFGHGNPKGLVLPELTLEWSLLRNFINTDQDNPIYVMSCYSGYSEQNYIGADSEILDAEAAGILMSIVLSDDSATQQSKLEPLFRKKQMDLLHPLEEIVEINVEKTFLFEGAAMIAVIMDRTFLPAQENKYLLGKGVTAIAKVYSLVTTKVYGGIWLLTSYGDMMTGLRVYCLDRWMVSGASYLGVVIPTACVQIFYIVESNDQGGAADAFMVYLTYLAIKNAGRMMKSRKHKDEIICDTILFLYALAKEIGDLVDDPSELAIAATTTKFISIAEDWALQMGSTGASTSSQQQSIEQTFFILVGASLVVIGGVIIIASVLDLGVTGPAGAAAAGLGLLMLGSATTTPVYASNEVLTDDDDGDGLSNGLEHEFGSDPDSTDSDSDSYSDDWEYEHGYDLTDENSPGDNYWAVNTLIEGDESNEIDIYKTGMAQVDRVKVSSRKGYPTQGSYGTPAYYDVSDTDILILEGLDIIDDGLGDEEWTDFKLEYQYQNDTVGTEFHNLYTDNYYAYDNDYTPDDLDSDYLPDYYESKIGTDDDDQDDDADDIMDGWEVLFWGLNPKSDDTDGDGLIDAYDSVASQGYPTEANRYTWDVDFDGLPNWNDFDADNDMLNDSYEDENTDDSWGYYDSDGDRSDLTDNDTDDDGLLDGWEVLIFKTDPKDDDSDDDGFLDGFECGNGLNPNVADSDDWALLFGDDFAFNDFSNTWEDISGAYGEMRAGGLDTTTDYNNAEADEDFVTRVLKGTLYSDDLDLWLEFDEGTGTTTYDTTSSYSQSAVDFPTWTTDRMQGDYALDFEADDMHYLQWGGGLDPELGKTYSMWYKPESGTTFGGLISTSYNMKLLQYCGSHIVFGVKNTVGTWYEAMAYGVFTIGEWHHVAATIEDSGEMHIYINGTEVNYAVQDTISGTPQTGGAHYIGHNTINGARLDGILDDLRTYDRELSADEVYAIANGLSFTASSQSAPKIAQYALGDRDGFVVSYNLTNLRSDSPAEAIESASIKLEFNTNNGWDSTDKITVSLVNGEYESEYISDDQAHTVGLVNETLYCYFDIEDVSLNTGADTTIDITNLIDYWYYMSNNSMMTLLFMPDESNAFTTDEYIYYLQGGSDDPKITIKSGDSILRADSFGTHASWHGPKIVHNFGADIDDFELFGKPYGQTVSNNQMGIMEVILWSGDDATGTVVTAMRYADYWNTIPAQVQQFWTDDYANEYDSSPLTRNNWYDADSDNFTIIRSNGDDINFTLDGDEKYDDTTDISTAVRSISIQFYQYGTNPVLAKFGLRSLSFKGHSDNYDDDFYTNSQEEDNGGLVWYQDDSFEIGDPTSNGWAWNSQESAAAVRSSTHKRSGNYGMRMYNNGGTSSNYYPSVKWDSLGTFTDITLSGWVYCDGDGGAYSSSFIYLYQDGINYIRLRFYEDDAQLEAYIDGASRSVSSVDLGDTWTDEWFYFEIDFSITEKTMSAKVYSEETDTTYDVGSISWTQTTLTSGYVVVCSRTRVNGVDSDYWYDDFKIVPN